MNPEFSRTIRIDSLGQAPHRHDVAATPQECEALARRFGLVAIEHLEARAQASRAGDEIEISGQLDAIVVQACVASGEPVESRLDEPFRLIFRPPPVPQGADEEVELNESELDVIFHDGVSVDLGEAVAETLSLALDPYPRAPGSEAALKQAGVKSEEEAGPFGALAALRDRLGK